MTVKSSRISEKLGRDFGFLSKHLIRKAVHKRRYSRRVCTSKTLHQQGHWLINWLSMDSAECIRVKKYIGMDCARHTINLYLGGDAIDLQQHIWKWRKIVHLKYQQTCDKDLTSHKVLHISLGYQRGTFGTSCSVHILSLSLPRVACNGKAPTSEHRKNKPSVHERDQFTPISTIMMSTSRARLHPSLLKF
jgi:hypothetical protein